MHIDVILDARATPGQLAELGKLAEESGIHGVWVSSLLDSRDPFVNLTPLAQSTSEIELGVIAVNPYDIHPVKIAASLLTLNEIANGRARIVIGGGGEALQALGIQPIKRVRAVRECIEIIKQAASGKLTTYQGGMFEVNHLHLRWLDAPPPPVYSGANQPQMLRMSARVADGVMVSDLPEELCRKPMGLLNDALVGAGRDPSAYWTSVFSAWHVYEEQQAAYREARQWLLLRGIFRPWLLETFLDPEDVQRVLQSKDAFFDAFQRQQDQVDGVPEALLNKLVDRLTYVGDLGSMNAHIEHLNRYQALGFSAVALRLYRDAHASIKRLGTQVVPALNEVAP